jgi:hypothetical protein
MINAFRDLAKKGGKAALTLVTASGYAVKLKAI